MHLFKRALLAALCAMLWIPPSVAESALPQGAVITAGRHELKVLRRTSSRIELARVRII